MRGTSDGVTPTHPTPDTWKTNIIIFLRTSSVRSDANILCNTPRVQYNNMQTRAPTSVFFCGVVRYLLVRRSLSFGEVVPFSCGEVAQFPLLKLRFSWWFLSFFVVNFASFSMCSYLVSFLVKLVSLFYLKMVNVVW